jgi:hypothetical protein
MQALSKRRVSDGKRYDHLFPRAVLNERTINKNADVSHTVAFIPNVVRQTLAHTSKVAALLKGKDLEDTCKNIWEFVYRHIAYKKDDAGYEQVRSPARSWHDRLRGVDCDDYTTFISSLLTNLQIDHQLRITKYGKSYFQHIYPIVPDGYGGYYTLDCVVETFNYEAPYTENKDYPMELQYLEGLDDAPPIYGYDDAAGLAELGAIFKKRAQNGGKPPQKKPLLNKPQLKKTVAKVKSTVKKGVHAVNRVNPATVLLRNGVLAAMKINLMGVAGKLKYSYLNDAEAQKRGMDMNRFKKLKEVRAKLEKIYHGAGGKPENLKKAILTGKGNNDKAVPVSGLYGLGEIGYYDHNTPLSQLLGSDVYYSENVEGMEGFGELGEPATGTAIAAASGIIGSIAVLLKSIGDFLPKKSAAPQPPASTYEEPPPPVVTDPQEAIAPSGSRLPPVDERITFNTDSPDIAVTEPYVPATSPSQTEMEASSSSDIVAPPANTQSALPEAPSLPSPPKEPGFWEKNKKWLKPVGIGLATLAVIGIGYHAVQGKKTDHKPLNGLSGLSTKRRKKRKPAKNRKPAKKQKKEPKILL